MVVEVDFLDLVAEEMASEGDYQDLVEMVVAWMDLGSRRRKNKL